MKERGILFSAPMVKALLAGTKTQTRRMLKSEHADDADIWRYDAERQMWESGLGSDAPGRYGHGEWVRCPYGAPGDQLWVRETFAPPNCIGCDVGLPELGGCICRSRAHVGYRATSEHADRKGWKPGIHMPRWASRITLGVTGVRVERLQDISEEDARAEGVAIGTVFRKLYPSKHAAVGEVQSYRVGFENVWHEINGRESWLANPWVWCISFQRIEARGRVE